jgi:HK97 family phage prohead protease
LKLKDFAIRVKEDERDGLAEGEFIGYASVFGNVDSYGEAVAPGAFAASLKEWAESGQVIPVLWGHNMMDPDYNVGAVISAEETDRGLKVHARLDMDSPKGAQVYRLLKGGRVGQMSFAFDVLASHEVPKSDDTEAHISLDELKLYEVSIVPIGANQETEILAVKSAAGAMAAKAGRALSAKNEATLRDAKKQLDEASASIEEVLAVLSEESKDQDKTSGKEPSTEVPSKAPSDQTTPSPSVSLAAQELSILALRGVHE